MKELNVSFCVDRLFPLIYDELRCIARKWYSQRASNGTLSPTVIVQEVYLRLAKSNAVEWNNASHFRAIAARAIRQVVIDYAREQKRKKRGGDLARVTLDAHIFDRGGTTGVDMLAFDEALKELASLNSRHATIVEFRILAGLTVKEVAKLLDVSDRTVELDWRTARAWLLTRLR